MRYARAEGRSQHVPVEGTQGADSPGGAPDPFVPEGASAGYCVRISGIPKCCLRHEERDTAVTPKPDGYICFTTNDSRGRVKLSGKVTSQVGTKRPHNLGRS